MPLSSSHSLLMYVYIFTVLMTLLCLPSSERIKSTHTQAAEKREEPSEDIRYQACLCLGTILRQVHTLVVHTLIHTYTSTYIHGTQWKLFIAYHILNIYLHLCCVSCAIYIRIVDCLMVKNGSSKHHSNTNMKYSLYTPLYR